MIHSSPSHNKRGPSNVCSALTRNQTFAVERPVFHMAALFQQKGTWTLCALIPRSCSCAAEVTEAPVGGHVLKHPSVMDMCIWRDVC